MRALWILLAGAGASSIIAIGNLVGTAVPLFQAAVALEATIAGPGSSAEPIMRDYLRIFSNTAVLYLIALVSAMGTIGVRYFLLLLRGLRSGHPRTLNMVRRVAQFQLLIEGFGYVSILIIFSRLEVIERSPSLGVGVLLAPAILYLCRRPAVKEYFSAHRIVRAPKEGETPTFHAEGRGGS